MLILGNEECEEEEAEEIIKEGEKKIKAKGASS